MEWAATDTTSLGRLNPIRVL